MTPQSWNLNIQNLTNPTQELPPSLSNQKILTDQTKLSPPPFTNQKEKSSSKLANKERCKIYRDNKKLLDATLAKELEEELKKHLSLERRARMMEEKVGKMKQMMIRLTRKKSSQMVHSEAIRN